MAALKQIPSLLKSDLLLCFTVPVPFDTARLAFSRVSSPVRNRDDEELAKQFKARPMPGRSSSVGR